MNSSLGAVFNTLDGEIAGLEKENARLTNAYNKEFNTNKKMNDEWDQLQETLLALREKIEGVRINEHAIINDMRNEENDRRSQHTMNQHEFNLQK